MTCGGAMTEIWGVNFSLLRFVLCLTGGCVCSCGGGLEAMYA